MFCMLQLKNDLLLKIIVGIGCEKNWSRSYWAQDVHEIFQNVLGIRLTWFWASMSRKTGEHETYRNSRAMLHNVFTEQWTDAWAFASQQSSGSPQSITKWWHSLTFIIPQGGFPVPVHLSAELSRFRVPILGLLCSLYRPLEYTPAAPYPECPAADTSRYVW